jgi:hypothetical protein
LFGALLINIALLKTYFSIAVFICETKEPFVITKTTNCGYLNNYRKLLFLSANDVHSLQPTAYSKQLSGNPCQRSTPLKGFFNAFCSVRRALYHGFTPTCAVRRALYGLFTPSCTVRWVLKGGFTHSCTVSNRQNTLFEFNNP